MTVGRRTLGRTGLSVPEVAFGCGPTAGLIAAGDREAARTAVSRALELGIDYFDTAPLYGDGRSERTLGSILHDLGAAPLIATKVVLAETDLANIPGAIVRSLEASLERLGRPRVAVLQLHNRIGLRRAPRADFGVGALLGLDDVLGPGGVAETFAQLRRHGLVEHFACSAYGGEMEAVVRVVDSGAFECLSVHYSLLNATAWQRAPAGYAARDYACIGQRAAALGMGVIAVRVLEAGVLAGTQDALQTRHAALATLLGPAAELAPTALRFVLSRPEITTALVGFSSVAQVAAAAECAAAGPLPDALLARIAAWQTGAR